MSTRATYQFVSQGENRISQHAAITLYIHHDGYPSGAAYYLWAAHHHENTRGGLACQFVRANEGAELTRDHAQHGDTEYRYTLHNNQLTAEARNMRSESHDAWRVIFVGTVAEFINAHSDMIEGFTPLRTVSVGKYCPHQITVSRGQLVARIDAKRASNEAYAAKWGSECGNARYAARELADLVDALADYDAQQRDTVQA